MDYEDMVTWQVESWKDMVVKGHGGERRRDLS